MLKRLLFIMLLIAVTVGIVVRHLIGQVACVRPCGGRRAGDVERLDGGNAEGMMLCALCEYEHKPPLRWFLFAKWDGEYDGHLQVFAKELMCLKPHEH